VLVPRVVGAEAIKKLLVFDEDYVSQFVFQPDEVLYCSTKAM
jgi:hypothetical protein